MLSPSAQMGAIQGKLPFVRSVSGEIRRNVAPLHIPIFDLGSLLEDLYLYPHNNLFDSWHFYFLLLGGSVCLFVLIALL